MLCYAMLYYTILYYTILYYTILYYNIIYYTIHALQGRLSCFCHLIVRVVIQIRKQRNNTHTMKHPVIKYYFRRNVELEHLNTGDNHNSAFPHCRVCYMKTTFAVSLYK